MSLMPYLARRLAFAFVLVFVVSSGALLLTRLAPGDITSEMVAGGATRETIARERARYGLDQPLAVQYGAWLARTVRLDLGRSMLYGRPVGELVRQRAANTAILGLSALALATLVGLPLGVVTGTRRRGGLASLVRGVSLVCLSLPPLVTSLLLVLVAARTGWLPIGGMTSVDAIDTSWGAYLRDLAWHLPVPALALAVPIGAMLERLQSQAMAEAVSEPCILAGFGRGIPRGRLIWRDALRLAIRPVASVYGLVVGGVLSGSFVVEIVTAWPGLGRLMYEGLRSRDLYLVAGCAAAGALFLAAGSVCSDLALAFVDPRLRSEK